VEEILTVDLLLDISRMNLRQLLSFLFYTGYLTLDASTDETTTTFRIPNEHIYHHVLIETSTIFGLRANTRNRQQLDLAIADMFGGNIGTLARFISTEMWVLLKHNDVVHSYESDVKAMFILAVVIALQSKLTKGAESEHHGDTSRCFLSVPESNCCAVSFCSYRVQKYNCRSN
jgi:hypothetical protein